MEKQPNEPTCDICGEGNSPLVAACTVVCGGRAPYCGDCWTNWIQTCEARQLDAATCPHCRTDLPRDQVRNLLGRAYAPAATEPNRRPDLFETTDAEVEMALAALGYRSCPGCQAWIERTQGCSGMECLCGVRFCWDCGLGMRGPGPTCQCTATRTCQFYDNVERRHDPAGPEMTLESLELHSRMDAWVRTANSRWVLREEMVEENTA